MDAIKVGLIGLGAGGRMVADALLASSWCELVAVASSKTKRVECFTEEHPNIAGYDDVRSLIVENPLEALFVAVAPFFRGACLSLAAERHLPVWMLTPAARRFDEAIEIMEKFKQADCPLVVSRSWGIEPAMQPDSIGIAQAGRFFLVSGNVMTCLADDLDWRGDSLRAGGGVLLDRGYTLIDTAIQIMGTPNTVYAAAAGISRPGGRFPYDTEDTAAVICQFTGGAIGVFSACWTAGPERWFLELQGTGGSIHIDQERIVLRDRSGRTKISEQPRQANPLLPQVEDFLSSLRTSPRSLRASIELHLATMAVIQAIYLSRKTGQPESPGTIFKIHDINETQFTMK